MADIHTLGLRVDAEQGLRKTKEFNAELGKLEGAGARGAASMKGVGAASIAAAAAITVGTLVLQKFIRETIEAQRAMAQLEAGVRSTGMVAGFTAVRLADISQELSKMNDVTAEGAQKVQGLLLTFTAIRGQAFTDATQAVIDMSTRLGGLEGAAIQVGKALNDPIRGVTALSRAGVTFTTQQLEQIRVLQESGRIFEAQRVILREIETQFGKSGEAARNTLGGALNELGERWGNVFEGAAGDTRQLVASINAISRALEHMEGAAVSVVTAIASPFVELQVVIATTSALIEQANFRMNGMVEELKKSQAETAKIIRELRGIPEAQWPRSGWHSIPTGAAGAGTPAVDENLSAARDELTTLREKLTFIQRNVDLVTEIATVQGAIAAREKLIADDVERRASADGRTRDEREAILQIVEQEARLEKDRREDAQRIAERKAQELMTLQDALIASRQELELSSMTADMAARRRIEFEAENRIRALSVDLTKEERDAQLAIIEEMRRNNAGALLNLQYVSDTVDAAKEVAKAQERIADAMRESADAALNLLSAFGQMGRDLANIAGATLDLVANLEKAAKARKDIEAAGKVGNAAGAVAGIGAAAAGTLGAVGAVVGIVGAVDSLISSMNKQNTAAEEAARALRELRLAAEASLQSYTLQASGSPIDREMARLHAQFREVWRGLIEAGGTPPGPRGPAVYVGPPRAEDFEAARKAYDDLVAAAQRAAEVQLAWAQDDLAARLAAATGRTAEAAAIRHAISDEKELEEARLAGRDAAHLQMIATVQAAEAAARLAAEMEKQTQITAGLVVRGLVAGGNSRAAEDAARVESNRREMAAAIKDGLSETNINLLKAVQFFEAAAVVRDRAIEDGTKAINEALEAQLVVQRQALAAAQEQVQTLAQQVSATERIVESLRSFGSGLTTGGFSPLSPLQQYAELQRQLSSASAADIPDVAQKFLEASRRVNASGAAYTADFQRVQTMVAQALASTSGQLSGEQLQLKAAQDAVIGIERQIEQAHIDAQLAIDELIKVQNTIYEMTIQSHEFYGLWQDQTAGLRGDMWEQYNHEVEQRDSMIHELQRNNDYTRAAAEENREDLVSLGEKLEAIESALRRMGSGSGTV